MLQRRSNYEASYMKKVIDLSISVSSPMGEQIKLLMENDIDHDTVCLLKMKRIVKCAEATRAKAYTLQQSQSWSFTRCTQVGLRLSQSVLE